MHSTLRTNQLWQWLTFIQRQHKSDANNSGSIHINKPAIQKVVWSVTWLEEHEIVPISRCKLILSKIYLLALQELILSQFLPVRVDPSVASSSTGQHYSTALQRTWHCMVNGMLHFQHSLLLKPHQVEKRNKRRRWKRKIEVEIVLVLPVRSTMTCPVTSWPGWYVLLLSNTMSNLGTLIYIPLNSTSLLTTQQWQRQLKIYPQIDWK